ncbi:MAG: sugar ABC transporter substrate-binding protein [Thermostichus sp. HHBFW_bins_43]
MLTSRRRFLLSTGALLLGACGGRQLAPPGTAKIRLRFWTMQLKPTFDDYLNRVIADFQGQYPDTTVEWVDVPWGEMETKILTAVAANTGPDVVNLNPPFASKLAERDALLDLETQVSEAERAAYFPNLWRANQLLKAGASSPVTFGLPWYVASDITLYNRALLEDSGWDADTPPRTYAELAQLAPQIRERTGKYAFMLTLDGSQVLEAMVQMGLPLLDGEGKAGFANPAGEAAFAYWVDLFQSGGIPREVLTESHRRTLELYQSGELAFLLTGPQFLRQIQENAPDIAQVTDVAPQLAGLDGRISAAVMNVAIPKATPHPERAVQFALFLTNAQNQLEFSQLANTLPSTVATAADPYFTGTAETVVDKARLVSAAQLPQAQVLIPPVEGLGDLQKIIYEELQRAMLGEKSVQAAVRDAAQRWNG